MTKKQNTSSKFIVCEHLDKIGEIAVYYGFTPMKSPPITKADLDAGKGIMDGDFVDDETERHGRFPLHVEEKIAFIRAYEEGKMQERPQPVMLYFKDPSRMASGAAAGSKRPSGYRYADLEILGTSGAIAEATLIQAARAILAEEKYPDTVVEVNSLGDRDSIARFTRELTAYYRKKVNDMTHECRDMLKRDPFELLSCHDEACIALNKEAPRAMDFLSETSRRHLEEVLEYLEALEIPYSINNGLIGNRAYCTETVFAIKSAYPPAGGDKKPGRGILAIGVRYNGLAKRLSMRRDIQGVGISILIKGGSAGLRRSVSKVKRPIASFLQLGIESKLLSLFVIEKLRKVKIPLQLSLAKDRMIAQVSNVERFHTPYVIVIGKKEAVERTAIVRRTDTHAQDIVPLEELAKYMKKAEERWWK